MKAAVRVTIRSIDISSLLVPDIDELTDDERANHLHRAADDEHPDTQRIADHRLHVIGRHEAQDYRKHRWQRRQDPPGDSAVSRHHAHLALDLEPLADDAGEVVEYLRQVPARLA